LSQFGVVAHYLRLTFVPRPLCLDYHWPPAGGMSEVWSGLLVVLTLLTLTAGAWRRCPPLGFAGVWFFLILAPTSSLLPLEDIAFEHRMYLPLAALAVAGTVGVFDLLRRIFPRSPSHRKAWGVALTLLAVAGLGTLTALRNRDYHSAAGMWERVIALKPLNPRAYNSLGNIVLEEGDPERALELYRRAIEVSPRYQPGHYNLANLLAAQGELEAAIGHYRETLEINPKAVEAHNNLGIALYSRGEVAAARGHFLAAMEIEPLDPAAHYNLGLLLLREGDSRSALPYLERARELRPDHQPIHQALEAARRTDR
jgi:tetratricopeptide (TPR) repeat protein